jgi:hypothetical protein
MKSQTEYKLKSPPEDAISSVKFGPNTNQFLLVSSWDGTVRLYDVTTNNLRHKYAHESPVLDCCFTVSPSNTSRPSTAAPFSGRRPFVQRRPRQHSQIVRLQHHDRELRGGTLQRHQVRGVLQRSERHLDGQLGPPYQAVGPENPHLQRQLQPRREGVHDKRVRREAGGGHGRPENTGMGHTQHVLHPAEARVEPQVPDSRYQVFPQQARLRVEQYRG